VASPGNGAAGNGAEADDVAACGGAEAGNGAEAGGVVTAGCDWVSSMVLFSMQN